MKQLQKLYLKKIELLQHKQNIITKIKIMLINLKIKHYIKAYAHIQSKKTYIEVYNFLLPIFIPNKKI